MQTAAAQPSVWCAADLVGGCNSRVTPRIIVSMGRNWDTRKKQNNKTHPQNVTVLPAQSYALNNSLLWRFEPVDTQRSTYWCPGWISLCPFLSDQLYYSLEICRFTCLFFFIYTQPCLKVTLFGTHSTPFFFLPWVLICKRKYFVHWSCVYFLIYCICISSFLPPQSIPPLLFTSCMCKHSCFVCSICVLRMFIYTHMQMFFLAVRALLVYLPFFFLLSFLYPSLSLLSFPLHL